jgi:hypothetical protein
MLQRQWQHLLLIEFEAVFFSIMLRKSQGAFVAPLPPAADTSLYHPAVH